MKKKKNLQRVEKYSVWLPLQLYRHEYYTLAFSELFFYIPLCYGKDIRDSKTSGIFLRDTNVIYQRCREILFFSFIFSNGERERECEQKNAHIQFGKKYPNHQKGRILFSRIKERVEEDIFSIRITRNKKYLTDTQNEKRKKKKRFPLEPGVNDVKKYHRHRI